MAKQTILLAGRNRESLVRIAATLQKLASVDVRTRAITNGHMDPLHGVEVLPTMLVLVVSRNADEELGALAARPPAWRPATLVIAQEHDPDLMRKAMRAGARDFLAEPCTEVELRGAVENILVDEESRARRMFGRITAVINAKGGSGATFIASSIAHLLKTRAKQRVTLVDLDFQFPSLSLQLDIRPKLSLLDALQAIEGLDPVALEGYVGRHKNGLGLLSPSVDQMVLPGEVKPDDVKRLIALASQSFDHIVCDLPRLIDPVNVVALEMAQTVVLVVQQTLAHIRDAKRLKRILLSDLEISSDRIAVVVNRYDPKSRLKLPDLKNTLEVQSLYLIRNDFENVDAAINLGVPIHEHATNSAVAKSLTMLADHVAHLEKPVRIPNTLRRALSRLWN